MPTHKTRCFLDIPEILDVSHILDLLDFLAINPGNPNKSMISVLFPHAKPAPKKHFPPEDLFSNTESKNGFGIFLGVFLGEKVSRGKVS